LSPKEAFFHAFPQMLSEITPPRRQRRLALAERLKRNGVLMF
jgi:hypothetical protein